MFLFSAAVCSWRLQRQLCLPRRVSPSRAQPLQPAELLQNVQPGQTQGGVPLQGRPQQEEEAQEQTQVLPTYVPINTQTNQLCLRHCAAED